MLINEEIINGLRLDDKIRILLHENKYNDNQIYNLNKEKIDAIISELSAVEIYKKNQTSINIDVILTFNKILFSKLNDIKNDEESNLKLIKSDDPEEILINLRKNNLVATANVSSIKRSFIQKNRYISELDAKLKDAVITDIEYQLALKSNDVLLESDLDIILDKYLQLIIPLIESVENHNSIKKDPNVNKELFSLKTKVITFILVTLYYNIMMVFIYNTRILNDVVKMNLILSWIIIDLILLMVMVILIPKKTLVKKETPLTTTDFEVVVAEEKLETKTFNKSTTLFNQINLKELCETFHAYLLENGLMLEHKKIRELFSAMSASRLVVINNKSKNNEDFLEVLNKYFSSETYFTTLTGKESSERDIYYQNDRTTSFIKGICYANDNPSNVNIVSLFDVDINTSDIYLNSIINFAKNPNDRGSIILDKDDYSIEQYVVNRRLSIPKNMWFILFTKENTNTIINNKVVTEAISIDIDVSKVDKRENINEKKIISSVNFMDIVNTAREEAYLSNEAWEKLDEIEKQLSEKFDFVIENKIVRKLETYASVYKVVSDDEKTTLDSSIANILLPVIFYKQENIYQTVLDILKDILDDENIVLTKEALNKYK